MLALLKLKKTKSNDLQIEIARLFEEMKKHPMHSDEYNAVSDQLSKLYKLQEIDSKSKLSKDQVLAAATSILGVLLIISYEHAHVLNSKALGFIKKLS